MGNEIYGLWMEASGTLEDEKLSAKVKRKRIEGIHARLTTTLVFHLGTLTLEVLSCNMRGNCRELRRVLG